MSEIPRHHFIKARDSGLCGVQFENGRGFTNTCMETHAHEIHQGFSDEPAAPPEEEPQAGPRENHDWFAVPVDASVALELFLIRQRIQNRQTKIAHILTPNAVQEQKRLVHIAARLLEIAGALEEGRLIIAERTIDHEAVYETWLMDVQIETTEERTYGSGANDGDNGDDQG